MLDSTEKLEKLASNFKVAAKTRHNELVNEEADIKKERKAALNKLRASHAGEEKALFASWEKEDSKRLKLLLSDEQKRTSVVLKKVQLMIASKSAAHTDTPPILVDEEDSVTLFPVTPVTPLNRPSRKRVWSPEDPDEIEFELSRRPLTAFERKRLDNLAANKALLDEITGTVTPPKSRKRRESNATKAASKKPVAKPSRKAPERRLPEQSELQVESPPTPMEVISISSSSPSPFSLKLSPPQNLNVSTIMMSEVQPWEPVVEYPLTSKRFYVMRCAGCSIGYDSVAAMLLHLKASNHRHLLNGDETGFNTVRICGQRIANATSDEVTTHEAKLTVGNGAGEEDNTTTAPAPVADAFNDRCTNGLFRPFPSSLSHESAQLSMNMSRNCFQD